jgi:hypothetical protein
LFPGMDSIMFGINMIGDAISAASAPPSAEAASSQSSAASAAPRQPAHPPPTAIWAAQLARWRAASAPVQREPDGEQQLCSMEGNPWPLLDNMESSSSACPAAAVHAHADGAAAAAVPAKAEVKAKTEAEMEVKEEAEMDTAWAQHGMCPRMAPPPRHGNAYALKRKAALHTAWAKQATARIEAMKIEKKEQEDLLDYQEEEHGGPTWVAAVVPPDATPSTPPDGSVVPPDAAPSTPPLMAAMALEDAAVAAAAAAAAAQREKEEAAAQMEAEYATAERAAAAKEAARAQTLAAAKALKEAVDEEDLLGLFLSDTDAETDEEQALHTAEHRAELDGIRLPT